MRVVESREFRPEGKSVLYGRCSAKNLKNPALGSPLKKFLDPPLSGGATYSRSHATTLLSGKVHSGPLKRSMRILKIK